MGEPIYDWQVSIKYGGKVYGWWWWSKMFSCWSPDPFPFDITLKMPSDSICRTGEYHGWRLKAVKTNKPEL